MIFLKSKDEYEKAIKDLAKKTSEIKDLKNIIQEYENENLIPEFGELEELRQFLVDEPEEGIKFKCNGLKYEVLDIEDFIKEYGYDQWSQAVWGADFSDLLDGGRIGVIKNEK